MVVGASLLDVAEPVHVRVGLREAADLQERLTVAIDRVGGRVTDCGEHHWVGEAGPRVRSRNPLRVLAREAGTPQVHVAVTWLVHPSGSWADLTLVPESADGRPGVAADFVAQVRDALVSALA